LDSNGAPFFPRVNLARIKNDTTNAPESQKFETLARYERGKCEHIQISLPAEKLAGALQTPPTETTWDYFEKYWRRPGS
jgi:hypothetical protein